MISQTDTSTSDVTTYGWDAWGKLNTVTLPNNDVITYEYDGAGRKARVKLNGIVEYAFLYQSQLKPVAQVTSNGALIARFVWGQKLNTPEYMEKNGNTYRFVTDPRGSVRLVIDANSGTIAQRIDYDEWGYVTNDTNPGFQPFGFAGGLYDHRTGLVEFGARHYNGRVARWLSRDPIWFRGRDPNVYGYVLQDPVNFVDPSGNAAVLPVIIGGGAIGLLPGIINAMLPCSGKMYGSCSPDDVVSEIVNDTIDRLDDAGVECRPGRDDVPPRLPDLLPRDPFGDLPPSPIPAIGGDITT